MEKNIGIADKAIRMITAIVLMDLTLDGDLPDSLAALSWSLITCLEITALIAWCPFYAIFHIHSDSRSSHTMK